MITDFMNDDLIDKFGGRFRLTAVIQKRWRELMRGARPMVDPEGLTELEVVVKEIVEGKVVIDEGAEAEESESD